MKIAVIGGNGDFGSSLVPYLMDQGHFVVNIDRSVPVGTIPLPSRSARFLIADANDLGQLVSSIDGCDAVVHLAAHRSPVTSPAPVVYSENTIMSYNVLYAAALLGIKRVCLASSINAIGGVYSRSPRYDYFPVDEQHPTYAEDPYALSKWVLEQQGDAFARRYEDMSIATVRVHWLAESRERVVELSSVYKSGAIKHLWAYTLLGEANRACLLSLTADFTGHEVFYIVAPRTAVAEPSLELAQEHYPDTPIRGELPDNSGFFDCSKAERILGWRHEE